MRGYAKAKKEKKEKEEKEGKKVGILLSYNPKFRLTFFSIWKQKLLIFKTQVKIKKGDRKKKTHVEALHCGDSSFIPKKEKRKKN